MAGLLPLSPTVIEAWASLMEVTLLPVEVEALFYLDAIMLSDKDELPNKEQPILPKTQPSWPKREKT